MKEFRLKLMVRVVGFKVATPTSEQHCEVAQREHINQYSGKVGEIIEIDRDPLHPYTVRFADLGGSKLSRVCRFAGSELN